VTTLKNSSIAMSVLVAAATIGLLPCAAWGSDPAYPAWELLSIGQPTPSAIGLRVWTSKETGESFKPGDRLIITVQADRNAYLTALCVSSQGNVIVLFPSKENPSGLIEKGKPYTLFGDDSDLRLTLGKKLDKPGLVFYLSPTQPSLDSLKTSKETGMVTLARDSAKEIQVLKGALQKVAGEDGFNRVFFPSTGEAMENFEVKLTAGPERLMGGRRPMQKKLPTSVDSTPPETVTGVQGIKSEPLK
jgi:hypothetical protein